MGEEKRSEENSLISSLSNSSGADAVTEFGNAGRLVYNTREKRREVLGWKKQVGLDVLSRVLEAKQ